MEPGLLNHRAVFYKKSGYSSFGEHPEWEEVCRCRASLSLNKSRHTTAQAGEQEQQIDTHTITMRYNPLIERGMRVDIAHRSMAIVEMVDQGYKHIQLTLLCREVD